MMEREAFEGEGEAVAGNQTAVRDGEKNSFVLL
jgi:hypothetical protein